MKVFEMVSFCSDFISLKHKIEMVKKSKNNGEILYFVTFMKRKV